jgi:hypothetical protein
MTGNKQHRQLRCFVASAFGHDDVDHVFTKLIKPTLRPLRVVVSRVDRVDHNGDIDNKIMEMLDAADFCIADLTYARPSVYYEAGYALATKPVIFIARQDHFKARDEDPHGNLRVHFDLQMKNIIPWGGSDSAFNKKLKGRVELVTRPLIRTLFSEGKKSLEREQFLALSLQQRIETVNQVAKVEISTRSFTVQRSGNSIQDILAGGDSAFEAVLKRGKSAVTIRVYIKSRFQFTGLRVAERKSVAPVAPDPSEPRRKHIIVSIFASLGKISETNLEKAFPHHAKSSRGPFRETPPILGGLVRSLVATIGQIDSGSDFRARISKILDFACSLTATRK